MSFPYWLTVAGLSLLPLVAPAQQLDQQLDPANANALAPGLGYNSAFTNYRPASDSSASPDKGWRTANDDVQKSAMHATQMHDAEIEGAPAAPTGDSHTGHQAHHSQGK